jgi:hypothetical protein
MCAQLHCNICKEIGLKLDNEHWYELVTKLVEIGRGCKITKLWYQRVQTDRTTRHNKPEIIIHYYENGTCLLWAG